MRHIGVDLHRTSFVACFIEDDYARRLETYPLTRDGLARFTRQLGEAAELAVEATQNVYYFCDRVKAHVSRVAKLWKIVSAHILENLSVRETSIISMRAGITAFFTTRKRKKLMTSALLSRK